MTNKKTHLNKDELRERLKDIKLLVLDVDGVMTDDSIYFGPDGFEMKRFNISDGFYIVLAMRSGLEMAIISGRPSPATTTRMNDLRIKYVSQKMIDKRQQIIPFLDELELGSNQVAFVGNEILDIPLAKEVGLSIAVADSAEDLIDVVDYVTDSKGGDGAVREIIKIYFESQDVDPMDFLS